MCTLVILRRPEHLWPVVIGANRDEMIGRPALPPARHWPDRPEVVAGRDLLAGGSWLGVNDWGVAAAILDRLMHRAIVFNIKGPSWRMREHQALTTATSKTPTKDGERRDR